MMGSPEDERGRVIEDPWGRVSNEGPQHEVTISRPFYLGKYEVTQAQWSAVMESNPARDCSVTYNRDYGMGDNYPVYYIAAHK